MTTSEVQYPDGGTPTTTTSTTPAVTTHVAVPPPSAKELPFTGGDVAGLAGLGLVAVLIGAACVKRARKLARG